MDPSFSGVTIFSSPISERSGLSHTLLLQASEQYSGMTAEQLGPLETTSLGKPFFPKHPKLHFSITHSGDWWLCAFSDRPVGLDLQIHHTHRPPEKLSSRFFHPMEDAFLARENYRRFFDLWSAKESWVKYTGRGFYDGIGSFSVVSAEGDFPVVDGAQLCLLPFAEGYSLCLCSRPLKEVRFLALSDLKES